MQIKTYRYVPVGTGNDLENDLDPHIFRFIRIIPPNTSPFYIKEARRQRYCWTEGFLGKRRRTRRSFNTGSLIPVLGEIIYYETTRKL